MYKLSLVSLPMCLSLLHLTCYCKNLFFFSIGWTAGSLLHFTIWMHFLIYTSLNSVVDCFLKFTGNDLTWKLLLSFSLFKIFLVFSSLERVFFFNYPSHDGVLLFCIHHGFGQKYSYILNKGYLRNSLFFWASNTCFPKAVVVSAEKLLWLLSPFDRDVANTRWTGGGADVLESCGEILTCAWRWFWTSLRQLERQFIGTKSQFTASAQGRALQWLARLGAWICLQ